MMDSNANPAPDNPPSPRRTLEDLKEIPRKYKALVTTTIAVNKLITYSKLNERFKHLKNALKQVEGCLNGMGQKLNAAKTAVHSARKGVTLSRSLDR